MLPFRPLGRPLRHRTPPPSALRYPSAFSLRPLFLIWLHPPPSPSAPLSPPSQILLPPLPSLPNQRTDCSLLQSTRKQTLTSKVKVNRGRVIGTIFPSPCENLDRYNEQGQLVKHSTSQNILRHCVIVNKNQGCFIKEINSSTTAINIVSKWETSYVQLMVLETMSWYRMDDDYGESYIDLEDDKEFSFSDTDSIDECGNVEHKNVDVRSEEHESADDQNEPTKHADADVAPDVYTNILELTEADIWDDDVYINDDSSSSDSLGTRRREINDNEDMSSDENNIHETSHLYENSGKQTVNHQSTHKKAMKAKCLTQISEMKPNTPCSMPNVGIRHGNYVLPPNHISPYAYGTPWQGMPMPPIYGVAPSYPPLTQVQFPTQMPTYFGGMPMDNISDRTWVDMLQNVNKNACGSTDVFLWRNKKISGRVLGVAVTVWVLFEFLEYHLLTLVCHLLIFALAALFLWSNASAFINKSQPKIPQVQNPEEPVTNFLIQ
ncbi:hypothetical protein RIF29_24694 [Crotalaria pallida]|uniref:Reticulon-like protein n=1 Tax=Crotalaria pallida TaxID=3830 RepID=A0AAN9ESG9_CROPI